MSEWEPTDGEYSDAELEGVNLSDAIYGEIDCPECGTALYIETFNPDADNPRWHGECCGKRYSVSVDTVTITKSDAGL